MSHATATFGDNRGWPKFSIGSSRVCLPSASSRKFRDLAVVLATIAAECLIAVWAATSPRPRLLRAIVVWLAIVPLIPIEAYWPALFFTVNAVWTVAIVAISVACSAAALPIPRSLQPASSGIADLLIVLLLIGTASALYVYSRLTPWQYLFVWLLLGLPLAPLAAVLISPRPARRGSRWPPAALAAALISTGYWCWCDVGQGLRVRPVDPSVSRPAATRSTIH